MKKLLLILQVIGLIAICPVYVALEMTHTANGISEKPASSFITIKTENLSTQVSSDAKNKIQGSTLEILIK
jgi:hypothetical protein